MAGENIIQHCGSPKDSLSNFLLESKLIVKLLGKIYNVIKFDIL